MLPQWMMQISDTKIFNQMFYLQDGQWKHTSAGDIANKAFDLAHGIKGVEAVRVVRMSGKDIKYWADTERNWKGYELPKADDLERYKLAVWRSKIKRKQNGVAVFKVLRKGQRLWGSYPYVLVGFYGNDYMNALAEDMFELANSWEWTRLSRVVTKPMTYKQLLHHQNTGYVELFPDINDEWESFDDDE